jgi:MFS family permease
VPRTQLGVASSLKTFLEMLTLIVASLLAGRLLDPVTRDPTRIMLVVMGLLAISATITFLGVRENSTLHEARASWKSLLDQFRVDFRQNISYGWLITERLLFLIGIYGLQTFAQYYLQDVLRVPDPPRQTGDLLAALTVTMVILVLAGGWLTDKYGAKLILVIGSLTAAAGMFLMLFATNMGGLRVFGSVLGAGLGLFLTSNWALATSLAPADEAGKYLGLTNLATAGSAALARLEGPLLDWLNSAWPGAWIGYKGLFIFGAVCMILSVFLLRKIDIKSQNDMSMGEAKSVLEV